MRIGKWDTVLGTAAFAAIAALFFLAGPARAADKGAPNFLDLPASTPKAPWSGVYLGLHGGYGIGVIELSGGGGSLDGLAAHGFIGGVHGGVDLQLPSSPVVLRGRCAYTWGSVEFNVNPGILSASAEDGWSCDAGIGYAMNSALPYVFAGYTKTKTAASFFGTSVNSPDLEGMRYGGGVEWKMPGVNNARFAVDYTFTDYKDLNFGPITLDADDHRIMARLNFPLFGK